METTASFAAGDALDHLLGRKFKVVIGGVKPKEKSKRIWRLPLLLTIAFLIFLSMFLFGKDDKRHVKGFAFAGNMPIQKIKFFGSDGDLHEATTNGDGVFAIKLKEGAYKICFDELPGPKNQSRRYSRPETTPLSIKLNRDLDNVRISVR